MNHHHHHHVAGAMFGRRRAILGSAAALAGAALLGPGLAEAKDREDDSRPQAAPKPIPAVIPDTKFHVLGPGPESIILPFSQGPLMGLHVDPSAITDFNGFTALSYPVGTARGSDGKSYNLEGDMRLFSGTYVPESGGKRKGTFALVWIDLYVPGSGTPKQVHDFNGGIQPSGLFWVVELAEDEVQISRDGRRASMHAEDVPVIDSFKFGGTDMVPAKVSFSVEWQAKGPAKTLGNGKGVPPDDPSAFIGEFAPASSHGSFSGRELAFSFKSDPGASSDPRGYAEMGHERNGIFL